MRSVHRVLRFGGWNRLIVICLGGLCSTQASAGVPRRIPFVVDPNGMLVIRVAFEFEDGHTTQLKAVLDTGSSESWIDTSIVGSAAEEISEQTTQIVDSAGSKITKKIGSIRGRWVLPCGQTSLIPIHIGDLRNIHLPATKDFEALIGLDALRSGKLGIDFEQHEVVFNDDDSYPIETPFTWGGGTIYINLSTKFRGNSLESGERLRYLIDTGQSDAIALPESYASRFFGQVYWRGGFISLLGTHIQCKVFPWGSVQLGDTWAGPCEIRVGGKSVEPAIGGAFFDHCKVQIDFKQGMFRIKRYPAPNRSPFEPLKPLEALRGP